MALPLDLNNWSQYVPCTSKLIIKNINQQPEVEFNCNCQNNYMKTNKFMKHLCLSAVHLSQVESNSWEYTIYIPGQWLPARCATYIGAILGVFLGIVLGRVLLTDSISLLTMKTRIDGWKERQTHRELAVLKKHNCFAKARLEPERNEHLLDIIPSLLLCLVCHLLSTGLYYSLIIVAISCG